MYQSFRKLHRWIGLAASLFLLVISATGFLLATKGTFGWIRPPESEGGSYQTLADVVSLDAAANAAFALGLNDLQKPSDIDRIDYRPKSNIFKVLSKRGYHEIQVDGATGRVLSQSFRRDQLSEDIHDLSYFADAAHQWGLPAVAILLFLLACTGIGIFFVPVVRRRRYRTGKTS